jgi:hypothetical protein
MLIFVCLLISTNGVLMLAEEKVPLYETPVIRRHDSPLRQTFNPRIENRDLSTKPEPLGAIDARSDLIRGFSLKGLRKWLKGVKGLNLDKTTNTVIVENINEMRTLSIALQQNIHGICQSLSTKLKQLDLKLKEIKAVEDKIFQLKPGFVKKSMKRIKSKSAKLKKALKKEKKLVKTILKQMLKKQKKILKVLTVYDKKFATKNKAALNKMMTVMNKSLTPYMKHSFFKKAYQKFITFFLRKAKSFNKKHFKNADDTARKFIKKHWKKFFNKEKKKWEKEQAKKEAKKRNKKNKKHKNKD